MKMTAYGETGVGYSYEQTRWRLVNSYGHY